MLTNLTELFWNAETEGLLRMCGETENAICHTASDYERFAAVCRSAELLQGHSFLHRLSCFLREVLDVSHTISLENAERIWQMSAERLLEKELSLSDWQTFSAAEAEESTLREPELLELSGCFDGNRLMQSKTASWEDWRREMEGLCRDAFEQGVCGVYLVLPKAFCFSAPDPYHVTLALQRKTPTSTDQSVLFSQLFRFLAGECEKREVTLILRAQGDPAQVFELLSYAEARVGLPPLIWNLLPTVDPAPLLSLTAAPHKHLVRCALSRGDYPTQAEWHKALLSSARKYPSGMLLNLQ